MSFERIPAELKALNQWIMWKYEDIGASKPTKVPYSVTGSKASVNDLHTWTDFNSAVSCVRWGYNGIGFVFTNTDPYSGIDLDFTTDYDALKHQQLIYEKFNSYSERSPSGKGLHIIVKGKVLSGRRRSSVEVYSDGRFFTFTGDIFNDAPIEVRQDLLDILWHEMGKGKVAQSIYAGNPNENQTDAEIIEACLKAVNGEKFRALIEGQWANSYPSQSEADLAFFNFVSFYTQSRNQIARLFLSSPLGQRDKAKRHAYIDYNTNKAFDQLLPSVDIEGLQNGLEEAIARSRQVEPLLPFSPPLPEANPYTIPPGLLGEIADFIYMSSPRPVPEIALAGAIALMAGICGRAYQVNGTGLNQYVLLLAQTGTGKEVMASGIDKMFNAVRTTIPAARQFIGPAEISSGQGLLKYISRNSSCFVSVFGEFGHRMQQLSAPNANSSDIMLLRVLLDLYHKSDAGKILAPMAYSQKEDNTSDVESPAVTLLGESTPDAFYSSISTSSISSGFLPRFTIIEYKGPRPDLNMHANKVMPSPQLIERFALLVEQCLKLNVMTAKGLIHENIIFKDDALDYLNEFESFTTNEINSTDTDVIRHIWNRAHIKVLRLAGIVAVGVNPYLPTITLEIAQWSQHLIEFDIRKMLTRFEAGEVGKDNEESKQIAEVIRTISNYLIANYETVAKYDVEQNLHQAKIIPYSYIQRRLIATSTFRNDRLGSTNALKRAISGLIETGKLKEIGKNDLQTKYGTSSRCFVVSSIKTFIREKS